MLAVETSQKECIATVNRAELLFDDCSSHPSEGVAATK